MIDQIVRKLEKEGVALIPNFLDAYGLQTIHDFFEKQHTSFQAARVGANENKKRIESIRGDLTYWLDPQAPSGCFLPVIDFLNNLKEKMNQELFMGIQDYECHLAYYPPGSFYQKHSDIFKKNSTRKLSFIFYLNQDWNEAYGGDLVLYDEAGKVVENIYPMPGSFVCFLSHDYPHEVKPSTQERRSLTGWMHTKMIY